MIGWNYTYKVLGCVKSYESLKSLETVLSLKDKRFGKNNLLNLLNH